MPCYAQSHILRGNAVSPGLGEGIEQREPQTWVNFCRDFCRDTPSQSLQILQSDPAQLLLGCPASA